MVLAAGLGPIGYVFAIFHLVNHGFFKANMFLGAGSVMHSFNNQENMRRFGGIRTVMVVTYITFAAGWLAIMGYRRSPASTRRTRSSKPRSTTVGPRVWPP